MTLFSKIKVVQTDSQNNIYFLIYESRNNNQYHKQAQLPNQNVPTMGLKQNFWYPRAIYFLQYNPSTI